MLSSSHGSLRIGREPRTETASNKCRIGLPQYTSYSNARRNLCAINWLACLFARYAVFVHLSLPNSPHWCGVLFARFRRICKGQPVLQGLRCCWWLIQRFCRLNLTVWEIDDECDIFKQVGRDVGDMWLVGGSLRNLQPFAVAAPLAHSCSPCHPRQLVSRNTAFRACEHSVPLAHLLNI